MNDMHSKLQDLLQLTNDSRFPNASEWHGVLCGHAVSLRQRGAQAVVAELSRALDLDSTAQKQVASALEEVLLLMASDQFEFHLYLPDDETGLELRTESLAAWCGGFISSCSELLADNSDDTVHEVIRDLTQISKASLMDDEAVETNEEAYFELVEYVRVAIQMVFIQSQSVSSTIAPDDDDQDYPSDYSSRLH